MAWQQILLLSSSSDAGVDRRCTAAHATGARRLVAQSFTGWAYARTGGPVKSDPPAKLRATLDAIRYLEQAVLAAEGIEGIVLRYGWFYGPGTALHAGGKYLEAIRRRQFPIIGDGTGVWSFIHIDDVASATLSAIERGAPGVYNIVDDEGRRMAAVSCLDDRCAAAAAHPGVARPAADGRARAGDDERDPCCRQHQSQAPARLAAALCQLARGFSERARRLGVAATQSFPRKRVAGNWLHSGYACFETRSSSAPQHEESA